jgi:hypothetical protein
MVPAAMQKWGPGGLILHVGPAGCKENDGFTSGQSLHAGGTFQGPTG